MKRGTLYKVSYDPWALSDRIVPCVILIGLYLGVDPNDWQMMFLVNGQIKRLAARNIREAKRLS